MVNEEQSLSKRNFKVLNADAPLCRLLCAEGLYEAKSCFRSGDEDGPEKV